MQKPITRRTVLLRRDTMPEPARSAASDVIADEVMHLFAKLPVGAIVAIYAAKGTEVDTAKIDAFARARGLVVAYPRVDDSERRLAFHVATFDALIPGPFGLREPVRDAATVVALSDIAALCDSRARVRSRRGPHRLGPRLLRRHPRGGAASSPHRPGIRVPDRRGGPDHPHDVRLHYVVTEAAVYRAPD